MTQAAAKVPESVLNPLNYCVGVVIDLLDNVSIGTLISHVGEEGILTTTSGDLAEAWTTTPTATSAQSPLTQQIVAALAAVGTGNPTGMGTFISTYLTDTYLDGFSSDLGVQVMTALSNNWDSGSGSGSPGQMNIVNQWNSLITSGAQNEQSLGQNDTKMESSVVQQDASSSQVFADMGNSVSGIVGNYASLLQQPY